MIESIHPKLPMRNRDQTREFYEKFLKFTDVSAVPYPEYLILEKDGCELHFFLFENLVPEENYGQIYLRVRDIKGFYNELLSRNVPIHPHGNLEVKPWGQTEFSMLDPDNNLLTFGESL